MTIMTIELYIMRIISFNNDMYDFLFLIIINHVTIKRIVSTLVWGIHVNYFITANDLSMKF